MPVLQGLIFDIKRFTLHDGGGIRTTIFMKGCPLNCQWCHNPESKYELPESFTKTLFLDNKPFCSNQLVGRYYQVEELLEIVMKDMIFYEESNGGVTASGGEPLLQSAFLVEFFEACKHKGLHTALDTSGFAPPDVIQQVAQCTDLFLYDLKIMDSGQHLKHTGVDNQLILKNLRLLDRMQKQIIIRIPLIEGINDTDTNLSLLVNFLNDLNRIKEIHLLPYHNLAKQKHAHFSHKTDSFNFYKEPHISRLTIIENRLTMHGYTVKIGG